MKPIRSAITLAAGIALVSLGAHAQTTQGAAPATTPQSGPAATSAAEPATQAVDILPRLKSVDSYCAHPGIEPE
ncbi:hypothetical protein [Yanghanlia caeni]|uniref:Uncharacterized protein n=1 Tax=Yanghanlia caeni TaxID=3064283 RepID=A0ABU1DA73_9BURK|nr:hypothetical protein [Alcaligenaceae bacterium LG-2]